MALGVAVSKSDINYQSGIMTAALNQRLIDAESMKIYFDGVGGAGLEALGFTAQEAAVLISAFNDLHAVRELFIASPFIRQLFGTGVVPPGSGAIAP